MCTYYHTYMQTYIQTFIKLWSSHTVCKPLTILREPQNGYFHSMLNIKFCKINLLCTYCKAAVYSITGFVSIFFLYFYCYPISIVAINIISKGNTDRIQITLNSAVRFICKLWRYGHMSHGDTLNILIMEDIWRILTTRMIHKCFTMNPITWAKGLLSV